MYTIAKNHEFEVEIKKSKFIAKVYKVYNPKEVQEILSDLRKDYSDATHICYAYKLNGISKFSDDGEPGGTAGLPMMEILNKRDLEYVLAVVIRYFGGIKLGSGGLVRAYSSTLSECIQNIGFKAMIPGYTIEIFTTYEKAKTIEYLLKNYSNIQKEYFEQVRFLFDIEKEQLSTFKEYNPHIINEIMIEKDSNLF